MLNSVTFIALTSFIAGQDVGANWLTDYWKAQRKGQQDNKPLAVFVGTGQNGYNNVSKDGILNAKIRQIVAQKYIGVYLDITKSRQLVAALEITKGKGLIISDRTGQVQAFNHDGDLEPADLLGNLERFANPAVTIKTTEIPALEKASPGPYLTLTAANFSNDVLKSTQPVVVDFWAEWCGPCKQMEPVVAGLAREFSGRAKIGKLNIDAHQSVAQQFQINAIPTILIFRNGQVVDRIVGLTSQTDLATKIKAQVEASR